MKYLLTKIKNYCILFAVIMINEKFMSLALSKAKLAQKHDEVPVGAVIVKDGIVISTGYNRREKTNCPTAHAEVIAIRKAAKTLGSWRLADCDLYVTLEPCAMCAGAIIQSRIANLYFGAYDSKAGCAGSVMNIFDHNFNHKVSVSGGILEKDCSSILTKYFRTKRIKK